MSSPLAQVKGVSYLSYITPLKDDDAALWSYVRRELPEASRAFFDGPIFANVWYPREHLGVLLRAFQEVTHHDESKLRALGARSAVVQVTLVYRMFLKFVTPAMVFRRASSVWSRQCTVGEFSVLEEQHELLVGELLDPDAPEGLPALMAGWSDEIIRLLGKKPIPTTYEQLEPGRWRFRVAWTLV